MKAVDYRNHVSTDHRGHHRDGLMSDGCICEHAGGMDEAVNIKIWWFAAEGESSGLHEEKASQSETLRHEMKD